MGRLFAAALMACVLLLPARGPQVPAQPVFFSLLFPQLVPSDWPDGMEWVWSWLESWRMERAVRM